MKSPLLVIGLLALISLTACGVNRNPLANTDPDLIAKTLIKADINVSRCADIWISQKQPEEKLGIECAAIASNIAQLLTQEGFGTITASDIQLPIIWQSFKSQSAKSNHYKYDADEARGSMNFLSPKE